MNQLDKALFLIEMAEQLLTKEMQKSKAIGPDRVNRALIKLTMIRQSLDTKIMDIEPHKPMPNKIKWERCREPLVRPNMEVQE